MKEITLDATIENIPRVTEWMDEALEKVGCAPRPLMQLHVVLDEVFSNIARYAYKQRKDRGSVTVRFEYDPETKTAAITFTDHGRPYNPLEKEDPDVTLSAEERKIGGLGVYMTKKIMDEVTYEYKDQCNRLTIRKMITKEIN